MQVSKIAAANFLVFDAAVANLAIGDPMARYVLFCSAAVTRLLIVSAAPFSLGGILFGNKGRLPNGKSLVGFAVGWLSNFGALIAVYACTWSLIWRVAYLSPSTQLLTEQLYRLHGRGCSDEGIEARDGNSRFSWREAPHGPSTIWGLSRGSCRASCAHTASAGEAMLILLWPNDGLIARARQLIAKCVLLVRARFPCKFASGELGEVPAGYR